MLLKLKEEYELVDREEESNSISEIKQRKACFVSIIRLKSQLV